MYRAAYKVLGAIKEHVLTAEFDAEKLCAYLGVEVNEQRLRHVMAFQIAAEPLDTPMISHKVVQVQLALEHMRKSRPHPYNLTGAEVVEVLLGSFNRRLVMGTVMWTAVLDELLQHLHSSIARDEQLVQRDSGPAVFDA